MHEQDEEGKMSSLKELRRSKKQVSHWPWCGWGFGPKNHIMEIYFLLCSRVVATEPVGGEAEYEVGYVTGICLSGD